ncbi:hypothetical protein AEQ67_08625 [Pseudomonas sp. RIT-PI-q]|uniref:hypothetical protein n=1 Tax=Pseudomonas sp. RIT-PI-q TaxID=1690247 RepID=UPI0006CC8936|nr:hypothetical protein [Pseudomonas sp. RIT-PI-q]KPH00265.1 hypothetical protein AEQ67_08625 [Pseudomonas sp. RIT-PI-q]
MDLYKDEIAFWDGVVLNYIYSNFSAMTPPQEYANVAHLADMMVLERRKRDVVENSGAAAN